MGQHLVMVATYLDADIGAAPAHAETAVRRAGRVPAARELRVGSREPWAPWLFYADAEALLARGDEAGALIWFGHAANADFEGETDAGERVSELDGMVLVDLREDDDAADGRPDGSGARTA